MQANRRQFIAAGLAGGVAATVPALSYGSQARTLGSAGVLNPRYPVLDEILRQPVLTKELFPTPIIIETLELLRYKGSFLCRVRSTDGAQGISVGHSELNSLYSIFVNRVQPFFLGKDARDLDLLLEKVYIYSLNFRLSGLALGVPLATAEFAILDMLGRIAGKSMGQLIGEIHHPDVAV
ncbi:MAG: mandelate racemase/muconate lactonizing enzyme family protein, partial [Phycisphaerales bacterium]